MDYRKFIVSEEHEGERIDKYLTKIIQDSEEEITSPRRRKHRRKTGLLFEVFLSRFKLSSQPLQLPSAWVFMHSKSPVNKHYLTFC